MNSRHNLHCSSFPHGRVSVVSTIGLLLALMVGSAAGAGPEVAEVFTAGKEAVRGDQGQDYAQFREQNVVVTNSGRVVVVCQGRNKSRWSDRSGQDLVVKTSSDSGKTWPRIRLAVPTEFAYSSLMRLPDGKIGLFYEGRDYKTIELTRFELNWLLNE